MNTDPSFKCTQCKKFKLSEEFGTRKIKGSCGQKGDRLKKCLSCTTINSSNRKRKHIEDDHDHTPKRFAPQPAIAPSQLVEDLSKYASASEIDIHHAFPWMK
jgi:hypothetical protein